MWNLQAHILSTHPPLPASRKPSSERTDKRETPNPFQMPPLLSSVSDTVRQDYRLNEEMLPNLYFQNFRAIDLTLKLSLQYFA